LSRDVEGSFQHFNVIKFVYYVPKKHGLVGNGLWIPLMLNPTTLDVQRSLFILTMKDNCHVAMVEPCSHNLLTILWIQLITSQIVVCQMLKYIKLTKIAVIQVLGSIEDEWCFNTFSFMTNKLQNRLTTHLDLVICMFVQRFYTFENFPFHQTIEEWKVFHSCYAFDA
jgi:hypothetical protein